MEELDDEDDGDQAVEEYTDQPVVIPCWCSERYSDSELGTGRVFNFRGWSIECEDPECVNSAMSEYQRAPWRVK